MFRLKEVKIFGFWGKYTLNTKFNSDVNIFIGKNGTGKTTFLNILSAALSVNIRILEQLEFSKIEIHLSNKNKTRKITIQREEAEFPFEKLVYSISGKKYTLPIYTRAYDTPRRRHYSRYIEELEEIRTEMNKLVQLSWLSVYREMEDDSIDDEYRRIGKRVTSIDQRLEDLIKRLNRFQLWLADQANLISKRFENEVLRSMLYDERFDHFEVTSILNIKLEQESNALSKAFKALGILDQESRKKIIAHFNKLRKSIDNIKRQIKDQKEAFFIDDILPLPLLNRTQHTINLSIKAEEEKKNIFKPIDDYLIMLRNFMKDKSIILNSKGDLEIKKADSIIDIEDLSSGEKQLFILLTETLLQKNQKFIFFADEPELSLHIEWQAMIIDSLKTLNPNSQIVVATHSPEIAGGWNSKIINMKELVRE